MPKGQKIEALETYFQEQLPDCEVFSEWKIDPRCFRFYFQDIEELTTKELTEKLEKHKWKQILSANSKKRIPVFKDKGFREFHDWPKT